MRGASTLPVRGEVFLDPRGGGRVLRVSWHPEADAVVLSLWREGVCVGTFRLPLDDVPALVDVLRGGLAAAYDDVRESAAAGRAEDLVG